MGFEQLSGRSAAAREKYGDRLPPGQYEPAKWPVLHYGKAPHISHDEWQFAIGGEVENAVELDWAAFSALPQVERMSDIHCVTRWSVFDNRWSGVLPRDLLELAGPTGNAHFALVHGHGGYTANMPLSDLLAEGTIFAHSRNGERLSAQHGGPVRLVVPHRYFWKSVKWVTGITLLAADQPGFWERFGYHNDADPWREQRYAKGISRS